MLTNSFPSALITANDNDEDDRVSFPTQRVRIMLRADDERTKLSITSESGVRAAAKPGKIPREGCVKAKDLIESDEWRLRKRNLSGTAG